MLVFGGGATIAAGAGRGDGGGDSEVMTSVGIFEIEADDGETDAGVLMRGVSGELGSGRFAAWSRISSAAAVAVGAPGRRSSSWRDPGPEGASLPAGGGGDDACCCVLAALTNKSTSDGRAFNRGRSPSPSPSPACIQDT